MNGRNLGPSGRIAKRDGDRHLAAQVRIGSLEPA
jgi:hypothetical protein